MTHTEEELNLIIEDHLMNCGDYANICALKKTEAGHNRIVARIKELIFNDGVTDIESAIATVDSEISWSEVEE